MIKKDEISISLPREIWQEIASVCINLAESNIKSQYQKDILRKTYFTIKEETR